MKKYLFVTLSLFLCLFVFAGCEKVESGKYKEGTYFGYVEDDYSKPSAIATAVVYVNENGMIKSVFLDTTYTKDELLTSKKALGSEYGMLKASEVKKEWYEQVNLIEAKVIENQDTSFITFNDEGKTDTIAGVTMKVDKLVEALNKALEQAK